MVSILLLNVRGLANSKKRHSIFQYCRDRADICCLQETHSTQNLEHVWKAEWGGRIYFAHGTNDSCGVVILIRPSVNCKNYHKI